MFGSTCSTNFILRVVCRSSAGGNCPIRLEFSSNKSRVNILDVVNTVPWLERRKRRWAAMMGWGSLVLRGVCSLPLETLNSVPRNLRHIPRKPMVLSPTPRLPEQPCELGTTLASMLILSSRSVWRLGRLTKKVQSMRFSNIRYECTLVVDLYTVQR